MSDVSPAADLVEALAALGEPGKTGKASIPGRPSYSYMQLPDLLKSVRETLAKHRLAVMQQLHSDGEHVTVTTVIVHASGERWLSEPLTIRTRGGAQDIGSAGTYARRYSLAAFVGLAGDDDDDGQAARPPKPPAALRPDTFTPANPHRDFTRGDIGPGTASQKSKTMMRIMLEKSGMPEPEWRRAVARLLGLPGPDWHTNDLSQAQVSLVIDTLKAMQPPPEDDDR